MKTEFEQICEELKELKRRINAVAKQSYVNKKSFEVFIKEWNKETIKKPK